LIDDRDELILKKLEILKYRNIDEFDFDFDLEYEFEFEF
jgi:hypothetical protein